MKLVWTKSKSPLSWLIRLITGEDCSHFAFVFESASKGLMFESNLFGAHPAFFQTSLKSHTIVHELNIPLSVEDEDKIWDRVIQQYDGKSYDFLGAFYLGYRILLKRIFKIALPLKNAWGKEDEYFCDELYAILEGSPGFPVTSVSGGMQTPHNVWTQVESALK